MGMRLQDRIAIVTGGGYGIGRAIAEAYAREGADVLLAARNQQRLQETAQAITAAGRRVLVQQTNVAEEAEVRAMLQACLDTFGRVDILVNNSGITGILWQPRSVSTISGSTACVQAPPRGNA